MLELKDLQHLLIAGKYKVVNKLSIGTYGNVFLGVDVNNGEEVAIKVASQGSDNVNKTLVYENKLYKKMYDMQGFAHSRWFGKADKFNCLVLDLLGPSLHDLFLLKAKKPGMVTVLRVADQALSILQNLHSRNYIHRDIRPDNFLIGIKRNCEKIYLIDLGLTKKYIDSKTEEHIPKRKEKEFTGTLMFASLNTHHGYVQSRRDDLQSLGFMLIYLLKGYLPWESIANDTSITISDRIKIVGDMKKQSMSEKLGEYEKLTEGISYDNNAKKIFQKYVNYCRDLKFEEIPDYKLLRKIFWDLFCVTPGSKELKFNWSWIFCDY